MARGNRGTTTTNGDGALGSAEPSTSPPAATSPTRSSKLGNSKKRKRGDNLKPTKRSKPKSQEGQQDHSADEESDDDEDYNKTLADIKLEEDEQMTEDSLDTSEPSLNPLEAEHILLVLERCVLGSLCVRPPMMFTNSYRVDVSNALDTAHVIRGTAASLRQILSNPSSITLRALRDRVRQQAPSTALDLPQRRASTSRAALKMDYALARFYQIALELLDDVASSHASMTYIDTSPSTTAASEEASHAPKENPLSAPAYALHQHLPTGDYFTSAVSMTRAELQSLPKGLPPISPCILTLRPC